MFLNYVFVFLLFAFLQAVTFFLPPELISLNDKLVFGSTGSNVLAIIILSLVACFILAILHKPAKYSLQFAKVFLLSGILSNLFDRIFRSGVADYISIFIFPAFNIADIFIVIGIIFIGLNLLIFSFNKKTPSV